MFGYVTILEPELKVKDFRRYKSFTAAFAGSFGKDMAIWDR